MCVVSTSANLIGNQEGTISGLPTLAGEWRSAPSLPRAAYTLQGLRMPPSPCSSTIVGRPRRAEMPKRKAALSCALAVCAPQFHFFGSGLRCAAEALLPAERLGVDATDGIGANDD